VKFVCHGFLAKHKLERRNTTRTPNLCRFVGNLLKGQTVGVIGAGCIVYAYAHMMIEGFKMNLIYYNLYQNFVTVPQNQR